MKDSIIFVLGDLEYEGTKMCLCGMVSNRLMHASLFSIIEGFSSLSLNLICQASQPLNLMSRVWGAGESENHH